MTDRLDAWRWVRDHRPEPAKDADVFAIMEHEAVLRALAAWRERNPGRSSIPPEAFPELMRSAFS
jgi:hypothetical protein